MNRMFSWHLGVVLALAGAPVICAQSLETAPKARADFKPTANAIKGPGIIPIGSALTYGGTNVPDTYSNTVTFSSTPVLVDSGKGKIWQEQVPTSADGEWDVFYMKTA